MKNRVFLAFITLTMVANVYADTPSFDRPGISFSPQTLSPGTFTWEQGLPDFSENKNNGIKTTIYSADTLVRAGLISNLEVQIGTALYNRLNVQSQGSSANSHGYGDSSIALKFSPASPLKNLSMAILGKVSVATGQDNFSAGHTQYSLGSAVGWNVDANKSLGLYANISRLNGNNSYSISPNFGINLSDTVNVYMEAGATHTEKSNNNYIAGLGIAWMVIPNIQLDLSADRGLTRDSTFLQAGFGISAYFN
jgi:hypothetical protein